MHLKLLHHDPDDAADADADGLAAATLGPEPTLEAILEAWTVATRRLEHTHEALQAEVARLTNELEEKNRELARQNRLADIGRMAAHIAHEVRNSMQPVSLYMSVLRRRLGADSSSLEILTKAEAGLTALNATVSDLLSFTAHREPRWGSFIASDLVEEIFDALTPQLEAQGIDVSIDVPPNIVVHADREMMRRAVLNLVLNAVDAMPQGGELVVTSYDGRGAFELEIADSGPGLSDEQLQRVFDPFFTTKSAGTGLGLSIVQRIVESHGGRITAMNCPQGGAAFTIQLPKRRALGAAA